MALTRSTVDTEPPDPREVALADLLHWVWSWRVQVKRLVESTDGQGQKLNPIEDRRSFSQASYDEHILAVAGWNLAKAIRRAAAFFPALQVAEEQAEPLRLLRNLYEHWDELRPAFQDPSIPKERSAKQFSGLFPDARPWSITYMPDDWLLGGAVRLRSLTDALAPVETEALQLEAEYLASKKESRTTTG